MDAPPASIFDRWTLEQLEHARREGVPTAEQIAGAARAADTGDATTAAALLNAAFDGCDDLRLLFLGFQFFFRTADYTNAERWTLRRLELARREPPGGGETVHVARAHTNLGLIHLTTDRIETARTHMERAVAIDERLGNEEGLARDLGNLANVHEVTGDLDTAESLNRRSLEIATRIGAMEIAAGKLANLGDIALARGNPTEARALWTRAVAEFERLGIEKWRRVYAEKLNESPTPTAPAP